VWGQHQFKVMADVGAEKYECECKHWEHTGMSILGNCCIKMFIYNE
jgi:hypothetical protein